jgi:hypothetical protein
MKRFHLSQTIVSRNVAKPWRFIEEAQLLLLHNYNYTRYTHLIIK